MSCPNCACETCEAARTYEALGGVVHMPRFAPERVTLIGMRKALHWESVSVATMDDDEWGQLWNLVAGVQRYAISPSGKPCLSFMGVPVYPVSGL